MSPVTLASMRGATMTTTPTEGATVTVTYPDTFPASARVGWIGLGKLGLTCAAVLADRGFRVTGYDTSSYPGDVLLGRASPPAEEGLPEILDRVRSAGTLAIASDVATVVRSSEVVFVSVQTPHAPAYGGEVEAPIERRDFEYAYLVSAVAEVCRAAAAQQTPVTVVVVSTVLPGTTHRLLAPLVNEWTTLVYNPLFIAMGTTVADYLQPEFVLLGGADDHALWPVERIYNELYREHPVPFARMDIESAELTKVAYNTFISLKIVWANMLMELCHKTGADCDTVVDALELAVDRVISPRYLRGGMGDGGHCHPRDLIAMSWLAERLHLSYDLLGELAVAREEQSRWLAELASHWREMTGHPITILGSAYKPESPLTGGSPGLLLASQLRPRPEVLDPYVDGEMRPLDEPRVFVIATKHAMFADLKYPAGSVVLDPWAYVPDQSGVTVIRIGRKR